MRLNIETIWRFLKFAEVCKRVPNQTTIEAIKEANDASGLKRYGSFRELRERI